MQKIFHVRPFLEFTREKLVTNSGLNQINNLSSRSFLLVKNPIVPFLLYKIRSSSKQKLRDNTSNPLCGHHTFRMCDVECVRTLNFPYVLCFINGFDWVAQRRRLNVAIYVFEDQTRYHILLNIDFPVCKYVLLLRYLSITKLFKP